MKDGLSTRVENGIEEMVRNEKGSNNERQIGACDEEEQPCLHLLLKPSTTLIGPVLTIFSSYSIPPAYRPSYH